MVLGGKLAQLFDHGDLADRVGQARHRRDTDVAGHGLGRECLKALGADGAQHGGDVGLGGRDVAGDEAFVQRGEFGGDVHHALSATSAS